MKNYYEILGISSTADKKEIRRAWLAKAKLTHPDHHPDDPTSEELFKEAQEAYRVLSDPFLRSRYDMNGFTLFTATQEHNEKINYYFYATSKVRQAKEYEEIAVTFTYTGRGRLFRKPGFEGFFVSGYPYISHRLVNHEGHTLKETTFTYLICATRTEVLEINPASIKIGDDTFYSEKITVNITSNSCHFSRKNAADGKPLKLIVHYTNDDNGEAPFVSGAKRNHTLLIPRSKTARTFHMIGTSLKVVSILYGAIMLKIYLGLPLLAGGFVGGLAGGLNCMIMYYLAGIKSKFMYARKYPAVQNYLEKGYKLGEATGTPNLPGDIIYNIQSLIF